MLESFVEISVQESCLRWLAESPKADRRRHKYLAHAAVSYQEHLESPRLIGHFDKDIHLFTRE